MPVPVKTLLGNLPNGGGPIYSISPTPTQDGGNLIITNFSNIYTYLVNSEAMGIFNGLTVISQATTTIPWDTINLPLAGYGTGMRMGQVNINGTSTGMGGGWIGSHDYGVNGDADFGTSWSYSCHHTGTLGAGAWQFDSAYGGWRLTMGIHSNKFAYQKATGTAGAGNNVTGWSDLFSVDLIGLAKFSGRVLVNTLTDDGTSGLQVNGVATFSSDILSGGDVSANNGSFGSNLSAYSLTVQGSTGVTGTFNAGAVNVVVTGGIITSIS